METIKMNVSVATDKIGESTKRIYLNVYKNDNEVFLRPENLSDACTDDAESFVTPYVFEFSTPYIMWGTPAEIYNRLTLIARDKAVEMGIMTCDLIYTGNK